MTTETVANAVATTETAALSFWAKHKKTLLLVLGAVLLFLLGFGTAKFASPAKVTEKTVVQTQVKTVIQYQDRIVYQKVLVAQEATHRHVAKVITKKPDGTIVTQVTSDTDSKDSQNININKTDDKTKDTTQTVAQTVTIVKTVTNQPNWTLGAGIGYSLPHIWNPATVGIPGMQGAVVQIELDRRILGPISMGAFVNTQATVGLSVKGSW